LEHSETIDRRPGAWRLLLHYATADGVPRRSFKVALIVGTALNLINQGDALFGPASINWLKLILTYLMPYAVSSGRRLLGPQSALPSSAPLIFGR
jgi:hypothetical protein